MAEVELRGVHKAFGSTVAVKNVNLKFPASGATCLLGPSGCGKTTLLRMVAGLESVTRGEIFMDGRPVRHLTASQRNVGMVFQSAVIYPGLTVRQNIAVPLERAVADPAERRRRVDETLALLELDTVADRSVELIDNATRQIVSVARAVARRPAILLFDEPITNLDLTSRLRLTRVFKRLSTERQLTFVYVTHDQSEAMTLASEVVLMCDGEVVQSGPPRRVYDEPATRFSGWFLGDPGMNFIPVQVRRDGARQLITSVLLPEPVRVEAAPLQSGTQLGVRPEHLQVVAEGGANATIRSVARTVGGRRLLTVEVGGQVVRVKTGVRTGAMRAGEHVRIACPLGRVLLFDPEGKRIATDLARANASAAVGGAVGSGGAS